MNQNTPLLFELSGSGSGARLPKLDVKETALPKGLLREELNLPDLDEGAVVRHYTLLSQKNFSVDGQFYPLGSCTMKYNPKANEEAAAMRGFRRSHPLLDESMAQGSLELIYKLQESLKAITGFSAVSLQPAAGAQGELTGILMIRAYHLKHGHEKRTRILIPDSAHGTNPATCTMAGFVTETIPSDSNGNVDIAELKEAVKDKDTIAGFMITNPSTLGYFEPNIQEIIKIVHKAGGLVYGDGANMNALMGIVKPADLDFDVMHLNLHKTFSTPHGGGGPGSGAVVCSQALADFLPGPVVHHAQKSYKFACPAKSIGRVKSFYGNFSVLVRAYSYIRTLGKEGVKRASEFAVLNANYLRVLIEDNYPVAFDKKRVCMHEFVASPELGNGIRTLDVAKRLIDYGFHPPTVYFPLIVKEAFMVEPTETENKETLEGFARALNEIAREAKENPQIVKDAPHDTPVGRLDETTAARKPVLRWRKAE
jgi:glycine dehydrogenase subunit 2